MFLFCFVFCLFVFFALFFVLFCFVLFVCLFVCLFLFFFVVFFFLGKGGGGGGGCLFFLLFLVILTLNWFLHYDATVLRTSYSRDVCGSHSVFGSMTPLLAFSCFLFRRTCRIELNGMDNNSWHVYYGGSALKIPESI